MEQKIERTTKWVKKEQYFTYVQAVKSYTKKEGKKIQWKI